MTVELTAAPVLSTPEDHLFEYEQPDTTTVNARSDNELREIYEVERTAREIRDGGKTKVALQFPDHMLGDAPKLVELLRQELDRTLADQPQPRNQEKQKKERIWILADTSYSACCVDEVAAEHVDADVVVHYGRSCLSPTSRLPVIYVFTKHQLDLDAAIQSFEAEFSDKDAKAVLVADVTYQDHVPELCRRLRERGYEELLSTRIQHNPLGSIPNRTVHDAQDKEVQINSADPAVDGTERGVDGAQGLDLKAYSIFHISTPPNALLLALYSRVASLHIHPTSSSSPAGRPARALLGRRYAKLLRLTTAGVVGILVNTLSVADYLPSVDAIRRRVAAAGKKSYTVVVGKLNPAKLANFAEIEGWVVVGCWESSLVEDDAGFCAPVLTPFELEVALMPDEERVWGLGWWGGIEGVKEAEGRDKVNRGGERDEDEDEDDAPVFDLRTGKLVSTARPMRTFANAAKEAAREEDAGGHEASGKPSGSLTLRPKAELATINGVFSPGAEYLRSQRTWQGLGTDFDDEKVTTIEEGRSGVARGYTVGEDVEKR